MIFQRELEAIAGLAASAGSIETGGDLYGLFSLARRPVIHLAMPAGPKAIHRRAYFRQDVDYTRRLSRMLLNDFGIQYLGNHHSHHSLEMNSLSSGDIQSTHSIASKNHYRNMCQILVTFDSDSPTHPISSQEEAKESGCRWYGGWRKIKQEGRMMQSSIGDKRLTVHAFFMKMR